MSKSHQISFGDGDPAHGTLSGYTNHGCRCFYCRKAQREDHRRWRARKWLEPDDPRHGTLNGYGNWGCRCDPCKQAKVRDYEERRDRTG